MPNPFDAYSLAIPGIRDLAPYNPGMPIEELERTYGISNSIKVASNENPLGPSPRAVQALTGELSDLHMYPDGSGWKLKKALAARHNVGLDQITLGNGSNEVLDLLARAFVRPGDSGVISKHSFIVYYLALIYTQAKIRIVDAFRYGHDVEAMANSIDDTTRIVYIANPNNPTGTWSRSNELRHLLNQAPPSVIVVVDEAYAEYVVEPDYPDCVNWLGDYPNLVVTRTFSKIFGLAGLRIGYAISSPEICDLLNRIRQPFNSNSLALAAALASIDDHDHIERSLKLNQEQGRSLCAGFNQLELEVIDSVGNFMCVNVGENASVAYEELLHIGVIVRPVAGYGLPNHVRVSIGTEEQNAHILDGFSMLRRTGAIVPANGRI